MTPIKAGARPLPVAALGLLGPACSPASSPGPGHSVLFVGNSLTHTNDLPAMVERLAEAVGDSIRVGMVAGPNMAVVDHTVDATEAIERSGGPC